MDKEAVAVYDDDAWIEPEECTGSPPEKTPQDTQREPKRGGHIR